MPGVFFYMIPIGLCVGIFFSSLFILPKEAVPLCLLLSFALAVVWRRGRFRGASPLLLGSVFLLCISAGLFRVEMTSWREPALARFENAEVVLEGVVVREPDVRESTQHLYIKEKNSGELFLATVDTFIPISYGDAVAVAGTLEKPEAFETDLGRTFDYEGYQKAKGVSYALFFADISVTGTERGNVLFARLITAKHAFMDALEAAMPEPQAGLAEGLLLGVKRALGADLEDAFRNVGIIHIVVLSGFNLMIVAEAVMWLLSFFFRPFVRMCIGIMVIALFAIVVGLSATVLRASLMAGLVLFARATGRNGDALRALGVAAFVMLLMNPYLLVFDPGFQLSFLATLGLVLVSPAVERALQFAPTTFKIREYMTATIATQIMILPLLLYLMGQFSVVAVLVNVLVLPMVPVAMALAFATGAAGMFIPPLAMFAGFFANLSLLYITTVATLFSALPFASFVVPPFPFWIVLAAYGALIALLVRFHRRGSADTADAEADNEFVDWDIVSFETATATAADTKPMTARSDTGFPFR